MRYIHKNLKLATFLALAGAMSACNDFLDQEPKSTVSPEVYFTEESQLAAYANKLYPDILPSHGNWSYGTFGTDADTDNQAGMSYNDRYVPGQWKTLQTEPNEDNDKTWFFNRIYSCNYFLNSVLPRYEAGQISGTKQNIEHYIGEIYFLRAQEYFTRYQKFGDFPITEENLPDDKEVLTAASARQPRNKVARFILSDLDKAIKYMDKSPDSKKTRISKEAAWLLKSRVALFEGTWLKYFKGTAFVPGGEGWPGASKDYNADFSYESGSIDNEINFFLDQAIEASKMVAEGVTLTPNTGYVQQSVNEAPNPYMEMYGTEDLSDNGEVLLWRQYSKGLGVVHCVVVGTQFGDYGVGVTRGMVDGFLMKNGLPIYAPGSGYKGDDYLSTVRDGRDDRLFLFLKDKGQKNILYEDPIGDHAVPIEPRPEILKTDAAKAYATGYTLRKGNSFKQVHCVNGESYTASITYRGTEAYLNYMEAYYERNGHLDETAKGYWRALRQRANVDPDFEKTIAATDMQKEAQGDWGAYSAGQILTDKTLYNIRRERRCEMMAEALRYMDLRRWRSLDQMITTPYHIEGFKLWGPMKEWYEGELIYGNDNPASNVSAPERSMYYRPYEKVSGSLVYNGYKWAMAHYLTPVCIEHMLLTSDGNVDNSPIYQNPYWPTVANEGAIK